MKILFENPQFLVIDKPAGWLSVPGRQGEDDVRRCLGRELEKTHGRIWPVHRLDLEVSGLILYARTAAAHREASMAFERHRVQKTYQAFTAAAAIETVPSAAQKTSTSDWSKFKESQIWVCQLLRGKKRAFESPQGKDSQTRVRCLGVQNSGNLLWELQPLTGRAHQLRYELSRHGYPILGDALYGSMGAWSDGIALKSVRMDFSKAPELQSLGLPPVLAIDYTI